MTVGELKKILADVRDDMEVWGYDYGYLAVDVCPSVQEFKNSDKPRHYLEPGPLDPDGTIEVFFLG